MARGQWAYPDFDHEHFGVRELGVVRLLQRLLAHQVIFTAGILLRAVAGSGDGPTHDGTKTVRSTGDG